MGFFSGLEKGYKEFSRQFEAASESAGGCMGWLLPWSVIGTVVLGLSLVVYLTCGSGSRLPVEVSASQVTADSHANIHPYEVDSNTRALWHFDEASGPEAFDATGTNNATALGLGEIVQGPFGNARYLRGEAGGDYLVVDDTSKLRDLAAITIEAWVKPSAFRGYRESFVQKGTATYPYNLYLLGLLGNDKVQDGNFRFEMAYMNEEQSKQSCNPISRLYRPGQWYYIAGTYDGQRCRLYINGVLEAQDPPVFRLPVRGRSVTSQRPLFMNNNEYQGTSKSNGLITGIIDEVRISDVARTEEEFRRIARAIAPNTK